MWGLEAFDNTGNVVRSIFLLVFMSGWNIGYYQWKTGVAILGVLSAVKDYAKKVRMGRGPGGGVEMTSVGGRGMAYE